MASSEIPFEYVPGPIPDFAPGETAEQYMSKLLPYLRDEFENIRQHFQQLPIVPSEREAPRAPFEGMSRAFGFDGTWTPDNKGRGIYFFINGGWWRVSPLGPYQHA